MGHFLWARPGAVRADNQALQWGVGAFLGGLTLLLAGWRGGWLRGFGPATVLGAVVIVVALYGLREGAMQLAARLQSLEVRHRPWESAVPLSVAIALAFGVFLPAPGSVYPRQGGWRYQQNLLPKLGPVAFAGASAVVAFAWAAWALAQFGELSSEATVWAARGHTAGLMLAAFGVLLPFSLFSSFDGRRVWDWKRPAWGLLVVAVLGLFLAGG